jgi:hypothetical protein
MTRLNRSLATALLAISVAAATASAQGTPKPGQAMNNNFNNLFNNILAMAKDFPAEKYDYRPTPEVRSFREVLIHIMGGGAYAATFLKVEGAQWGDFDATKYKTKAEVVALVEKTIADCRTRLKEIDDERWAKTLAPWPAVIEHSAEHFGQLIVYYRLNGLVPPQSRK